MQTCYGFFAEKITAIFFSCLQLTFDEGQDLYGHTETAKISLSPVNYTKNTLLFTYVRPLMTFRKSWWDVCSRSKKKAMSCSRLSFRDTVTSSSLRRVEILTEPWWAITWNVSATSPSLALPESRRSRWRSSWQSSSFLFNNALAHLSCFSFQQK